MSFYDTVGKENASLTAQHFGNSMKTFYNEGFRNLEYDVDSKEVRSNGNRNGLTASEKN